MTKTRKAEIDRDVDGILGTLSGIQLSVLEDHDRLSAKRREGDEGTALMAHIDNIDMAITYVEKLQGMFDA